MTISAETFRDNLSHILRSIPNPPEFLGHKRQGAKIKTQKYELCLLFIPLDFLLERVGTFSRPHDQILTNFC